MARHEREEFMMEFKVGDRVKQRKPRVFHAVVGKLVGTVVEIREGMYPIGVIFPKLNRDEDLWNFEPEELKLVKRP